MTVKFLRITILLAVVLALGVVTLGAYTRLTNSGLGCPDWPGCYGTMVLPSQHTDLENAQRTFPSIPLEPKKAWTEMIHRYAAGSLGVLILVILSAGIFYKTKIFSSSVILVVLGGLLIFQALLGMWTVTLKLLPVVVMSHLLGGVIIFSSLLYLFWNLSPIRPIDNSTLKYWVLGGIVIVFIQIALGGWVSSNYAGIACIGFPTCNGLWIPEINFSKGFNLFSPVGVNYQGGVLDNNLRIAIQFVHRIGAMITALYLCFLSIYILLKKQEWLLRVFAYLILLLILLQFTLGIINVTHLLPLWAAVAHNGVAAVILGTLFSMFYFSKGHARYAV